MNEDGYALFLVFIVLTVSTLLLAAILRITITEVAISKNHQESIKGYYLVEGVVNLSTREVYEGLKQSIMEQGYIDQKALESLCKEGTLEITDSTNQKLTIKYKILKVIDESAKVNINLASKKMLESLSGIGVIKANNIIAKRKFNTIEELSQVSGIGKLDNESDDNSQTYEKIKNNITVRSDAKININTASEEVLKTLDNIGNNRASKIKISRPFVTKDGIKNVNGIGEGIYSKLEDKIKVSSKNFKMVIRVNIEDMGIEREIERFIRLK